MALREFALGIEALERFVKCEPLYRVHECVFEVLAWLIRDFRWYSQRLCLMEDFFCVGGKLSLSIRSIQWPDLAALGSVVSISGSW